MSILVIGATGTLGRQIVKELLTAGYQVRCLVRNIRKANFLSDWGAQLVYGDLTLPETIPLALTGITTVIDASTLRPEEELATLQEVDLIGKIALIKAAKVAKIDKFIFFSIEENEKYQTIPLMQLKKKVESILINSNLSYTIFQISGFYQGLIAQYAIPILEQQNIYTTQDYISTTYIDSRDIARTCTKRLIIDSKLSKEKNQIIKLEGPKKWKASEIIKICEEISGQKAKINFTAPAVLSLLKNIMGLSKWTWSIQDRLAFSEVISKKENNKQDFVNSWDPNLYSTIKFNSTQITLLEDYFQEYFENILKRLRDLNFDQNQITKRKDLTF